MRQKIGQIGEDIACKYLKNIGFSVVCRNYRKKWGEIDIILKKGNLIHFVEVKSVSRENIEKISQETDQHNPEDNIHEAKLKRISRTVQSYLMENEVEEGNWQFDVVAVFIDIHSRKARVRYLPDIVL